MEKKRLRINPRVPLYVVVSVVIALVAGVGLFLAFRLPHTLVLSSSAFKDKATLPAQYTCDGENINPPFTITGAESRTKSFALLFEDVTLKGGAVHWMTWNIPVQEPSIQQGIRPSGTAGRNIKGDFGYTGPCPDFGKEHNYLVTVYALKVDQLAINSSASLEEFKKAVNENLVDVAVLHTHYARKGSQ